MASPAANQDLQSTATSSETRNTTPKLKPSTNQNRTASRPSLMISSTSNQARLQSRITQLETSIEHTRAELATALVKITELESFKSKHDQTGNTPHQGGGRIANGELPRLVERSDMETKSRSPAGGTRSSGTAVASPSRSFKKQDLAGGKLTDNSSVCKAAPQSEDKQITSQSTHPPSDHLHPTPPPAPPPSMPPHLQALAEQHASQILQSHVKMLGKYNEIKDIAMNMLGIIADNEGRTMAELLVGRGIEDDD